MSIKLASAARIAEANATTNLLNGGKIKIYSGTAPDPDAAATGTLLVELIFANPAFALASDDGTNADALANSLNTVSAIASGTASYYRATKADDTVVFQGTITGSGGGGDMELSGTAITSGETISVTSFVYRKTEV